MAPVVQVVPEYVTKIIQVFDCKVARHGNMIVGRTGSGKSEAWKALQVRCVLGRWPLLHSLWDGIKPFLLPSQHVVPVLSSM